MAIIKHRQFLLLSTFTTALGNGQILAGDLCFIHDVKKVYLNGVYYAGETHSHAISAITGLDLALNSKLNLAGGTMTGSLVLNSDPSTNLQAATKQYVDSLVSGVSSISKTYSELAALVSSSGLVPGRKYLLTDYATKYQQPVSMSIFVGDTEVLMLTASSVNTFEPIALSQSHPEDIVYYNFYDVVCEDLTTARKGMITKRINTINGDSVVGDFRHSKWERFKILVGDSYTPSNSGHKLWTNEALVLGDIIIDNNTTPKSICVVMKSGTPTDHEDALANYLQVIPFNVNDYFLSGIHGDGGSPFVANTTSIALRYTFNGASTSDFTSYASSTADNSYYGSTGSYTYISGNEIKSELGIRHNTVLWVSEGSYVNSNKIDSSVLTSSVNGFENNTIVGESMHTAYYDYASFNTISGALSGSVVYSMTKCLITGNQKGLIIGNTFSYNKLLGQSNFSVYGNGCKNNTIKGGNIYANDGLINNNINIGSTSGSSIELDLFSATHVYDNKTCDIFVSDLGGFYLSYFNETVMAVQYFLATT